MNITITNILFIIAGLFLLPACSNTKYLPEGDALYTGAKVKVNAPTLSSKKRGEMENSLHALIRPNPNKKMFGLRVKLFAYNITGHPKSDSSLRGKVKYKFGEAPVLLSSVKRSYNEQILENNLQNQGYFNAVVKSDIIVKRRRATVIYTTSPALQYTINDIFFDTTNTILQTTINQTAKGSLLKKGNPYNLDVIKAERERIDGDLKEKGFYFFNPEYIIVNVDSTIGKEKVNMYVKIKKGTPASAKTPYSINNVYIYPNYKLNRNSTTDTAISSAIFYNGYYLIDSRNQFKPSVFENTMQFKSGDTYNRTEHNETLSRLISLNEFKFVKNRFETVPGLDSPKLNTYYYLTPMPKKSINLELNGTSKSNDLVGSIINLTWRNRNTFRGAEALSIKAYGGFEVQYGGAWKGYNTYRTGLEANLSFPKFIVPFFQIKTHGNFMPKTNIMAGYDLLTKNNLYTLNSFRTSLGYFWKNKATTENKLYPININYVQPLNVTQQYLDSAAKDPSLQHAIDKQFIIGSMYNYTYNPMMGAQNVNGIYFSGNIELSGNIAGLIKKGNVLKGDTAYILNAAYSQFLKGDIDFRAYRKLGKNSVWANRLIVGLSYPYGNSSSLPYIKQYFSGGNNSIRAFRSRSIGPGSYNYPATSGIPPDESGDMKLEINTEARAKLFSIVDGALFIDAGNIWLFNEDPLRPGGKFSKNFLSELAVGAGAGIRFDISILVLRLDVAMPLRKPFLPSGERWVFNQIDFGNSQWRKDNIILNIAIGYPF